jgi:serine/threonine protein kinase
MVPNKMKKLKHPNIVRFLGISIEISSMVIVTELMNGGDLRYFVRQFRTQHQVSDRYIYDIYDFVFYI